MKNLINKALFLIESPFQLLGAYEAISVYNIGDFKIYIRLSSTKNNDFQLEKLATELFNNSNNITYFYIKAKRKSFLDLCTLFFMSLYILVKSINCKYIFVGNYDSNILDWITKLIKKEKIVLLDDGIKNILIQNNFTEYHNYNIFTMLLSLRPYNKQKIIYNTFSEFKKIINKVDMRKSNDILFVGIDLCEAGVIEESTYIKFIDKISKKNSEKMIYIPHRAESDSKLNKIGNLPNILVKKIDYPIEFYPYYMGMMPDKILSFYSGALISLSNLYSNLDITSYKFDYTNNINSSSIDSVYLYLKNYVKVEEIEIQ